MIITTVTKRNLVKTEPDIILYLKHLKLINTLKKELKTVNKCFFYRYPDHIIDIYRKQLSSLPFIKTFPIKTPIKKIKIN